MSSFLGKSCRSFTLCALLLLFLSNLARLVEAQGEGGHVCLMIYQMADTSDIEENIIDDLVELTKAPGLKDPTLMIWVYHDGRENSGENGVQSKPINNIWTADGSQRITDITTTKFEGTRYFHYNHKLKKMLQAKKLEVEQNSDDPEVMFKFFSHAMEDCIKKGSKEFFVTLSSHGSGYAGFGGDSNKGRRKLTSNQAIVQALKSVLHNVEGAPRMYDVIGFDACLMQSLGAVDDYAPITKYYLASEAVEPGHGWNYEAMTDTSSALAIARQFVDTFVGTKQGPDHQTPKTLAIVKTNYFPNFNEAFESFIVEVTNLLKSNNDANFFEQLHRARADSIDFEASDDEEDKTKSHLDLGSFMATFEKYCNPKPATSLAKTLKSARDAYGDLFELSKIGPGTKEGTGMAVMWPSKKTYDSDPELWKSVLEDLQKESTYKVPELLKAYFETGKPQTSGDNCSNGAPGTAENDPETTTENELETAKYDPETDALH